MSLRVPHLACWAMASVLVISSAGVSMAQVSAIPGDQTQRRSIYNEAITCFIANSYAKSLRENVGDKTKAGVYDAQANHSYDMAYALGGTLAIPNDRIDNDIVMAQRNELPLMVKDQSAFFKIVAECKFYHLM